MDKNKQPGIKFERFFLSKLNYELPQVEPTKFKYSLSIESGYKIDKDKLISTLTIQLYDKFGLELTGVFSTRKGEENMDLARFAELNAPSILLPFAREIISNITAKSPLPHLLLPPINMIALRQQAKAGQVAEKISK